MNGSDGARSCHGKLVIGYTTKQDHAAPGDSLPGDVQQCCESFKETQSPRTFAIYICWLNRVDLACRFVYFNSSDGADHDIFHTPRPKFVPISDLAILHHGIMISVYRASSNKFFCEAERVGASYFRQQLRWFGQLLVA
jgi:hypothetical protein